MDPMGYPEDPPFFLLTISIHHLYNMCIHLFDAFLVWNPLTRVQLIAIPGCFQMGRDRDTKRLDILAPALPITGIWMVRASASMPASAWASCDGPAFGRPSKIARRSDVAAGARLLRESTWRAGGRRISKPRRWKKKGSWNHVRFTILKGIHHV